MHVHVAEEPRTQDAAASISTSGWRDCATAVGLYTLAALAAVYAVLPNFSTRIIGPAEDNMRSLWNLWYGVKALTGGEHSLEFTRLIFYPDGASLLYNDFSFYNLLLSAPLQAVFSLPAVYNILIIQTFILAGLGSYLLARHVTGHHVASLVAGLLFALCPTHLAQSAHHLNIASVQFLPFFILFFIKAVSADGLYRPRLLSALFYLLLTICSWTWGIAAGIFMLAAYAWMAIRDRRLVHRPALLTICTTVIPTLVILSPWLAPMLLESVRGDGVAAVGHDLFVADLLALFVPPAHTLPGQLDMFEQLRSKFTGNQWESIAWLGMANLVLLVVAVRSQHRAVAPIVFGSTLFLLLALGPNLHINGMILHIPLPFGLCKSIPVLDQLRCPARMMMLVYLGLALTTAIGLRHLLTARPRGWRAVSILLVLVALFEYGGVVPRTTATELPPAYAAIMADPDATAIVDIPSSWAGNSRYMMHQTSHGLPIVQGLLPRRTDRALIDDLAFLNPDLLRFQLTISHVSHIVVHRHIRPEASDPTIELYTRHFPLLYSDDNQVVFKVR